jgi:hypothetical protein
MNTPTRRQRFRHRIEIERKVLTEVNSKLHVIKPLTGITESTVFQWHNDLAQKLRPVDAREISDLIIEIARRSSFDSDCSRDVFEEGELVLACSVDDLLLRLGKKVSQAAEVL